MGGGSVLVGVEVGVGVSVGGGVRLTLDFFGKVPMEFDLAFPISKDSEDDTRVFNFYIGLPFF